MSERLPIANGFEEGYQPSSGPMEPEVATCPVCCGAGHGGYEERCCGNYLSTGECCAAQYGTANVIVEPMTCPACGGSGEVYRD